MSWTVIITLVIVVIVARIVWKQKKEDAEKKATEAYIEELLANATPVEDHPYHVRMKEAKDAMMEQIMAKKYSNDEDLLYDLTVANVLYMLNDPDKWSYSKDEFVIKREGNTVLRMRLKLNCEGEEHRIYQQLFQRIGNNPLLPDSYKGISTMCDIFGNELENFL
ncbi:MAG: hypothetical protein K9J17_08035 [Flavobacteriales bacterium]|nr:hypothetical protein [Flavobacteriales bacterium]